MLSRVSAGRCWIGVKTAWDKCSWSLYKWSTHLCLHTAGPWLITTKGKLVKHQWLEAMLGVLGNSVSMVSSDPDALLDAAPRSRRCICFECLAAAQRHHRFSKLLEPEDWWGRLSPTRLVLGPGIPLWQIGWVCCLSDGSKHAAYTWTSTHDVKPVNWWWRRW
jgi:hypothetical protein